MWLQLAEAASSRKIEPQHHSAGGRHRRVPETSQDAERDQRATAECSCRHVQRRTGALSEPSRNERGRVQAERDTEARIKLHERLGRGERAEAYSAANA